LLNILAAAIGGSLGMLRIVPVGLAADARDDAVTAACPPKKGATGRWQEYEELAASLAAA
jgi:hypothetical protein